MNTFKSVFKKLEMITFNAEVDFEKTMNEIVEKTVKLQNKRNIKNQDIFLYIFDKCYKANNEFIFHLFISQALKKCVIDVNHQDKNGNTLLMKIFSHYDYWKTGKEILAKYMNDVDFQLENNSGQNLLEVTLGYQGYHRAVALENLYFVLKANKVLKNGSTLLAEVFKDEYKVGDMLSVYKKILSNENIDKTLKDKDGAMAIEHIVRNINTFDYAKHIYEFYHITRVWCDQEVEKQPENIRLKELAEICVEQEAKWQENKNDVMYERNLREQMFDKNKSINSDFFREV